MLLFFFFQQSCFCFKRGFGLEIENTRLFGREEEGGQDLNIYKYPSHMALRMQRVLYSDCV